MRNAPVLDGRTLEDLLEAFKKRAGEYTPEWKYERDAMDAGGALAEIFCQMHYETVDRFNLIPEKYYEEFLNLLRVPDKNVTMAIGFVKFSVSEGAEKPVAIPAHTEVYAKTDGGDNIIYQTQRNIDATDAAIEDIFFIDSANGIIERFDMREGGSFFASNGGENLQKHRLLISENDALSLDAPAEIELELKRKPHFMENDIAALLSDEKYARYYYFDGEAMQPFDGVRCKDNVITLVKNNSGVMRAQDGEHISVCCELSGALQQEITLDGAAVRSRLIDKEPQNIAAAFNTVPIDMTDGGYCFGRRPTEYDQFYMRSDCVFNKRGAHIAVTLDIAVITHSDIPEAEAEYTYGQPLIDKNDAVKPVPDDVYIDEVVFEYFNGIDWARLEVTEDRNPFLCKTEGKKLFCFYCPQDSQPVVVNGEEGYYIRARVVNVANYLSTKGRWLLPFVRRAGCVFDYEAGVGADRLESLNNARSVIIDGAKEIETLSFPAYTPQEHCPPSMYIKFDKSPDGMPLSMFFWLSKGGDIKEKLQFEGYTEKGFKRFRAIDLTDNFKSPGYTLIYVSEPLAETEMFGQTGCFLRISTHGGLVTPPEVKLVDTNVMLVYQMQKQPDQYFTTEIYEAHKEIALLEAPVLWCEVWVDEKSSFDNAEITRMERANPGSIRIERQDSEIQRCFIKYEQIRSLRTAGPNDRVYELAAYDGVIRFGDGVHGRVPPEGSDNIRVSYATGGGAAGNVKKGSVEGLVNSVPFINQTQNIGNMTGGNDRMPFDKQKYLGNKFIRHRRRAVTAEEFELITLDEFTGARHVKCFENTDENGRAAPGHVTVAVECSDDMDPVYMEAYCRNIYDLLKTRCDCNLVISDMLHVRPAQQVTINTVVTIELDDPDLAAATHHSVVQEIINTIQNVWEKKPIGRQISVFELHRAVKEVPNVSAIRRLLIEGVFDENGRRHVIPIDQATDIPFATVKNGYHTVYLS